MLGVIPNGSASYKTFDIIELHTWILNQGWINLPAKSIHEYTRVRSDNALIVIYRNGTVLL